MHALVLGDGVAKPREIDTCGHERINEGPADFIPSTGFFRNTEDILISLSEQCAGPIFTLQLVA